MGDALGRGRDGQAVPHSRRAAGAACFEDAFWVYGGFGASGTVSSSDVSDALWRYAGGAWERVCQGPLAARYPSFSAGPDGLVMFGGCGYDGRGPTFESRVWRYDGRWVELTPEDGPAPHGRYTSLLARRGADLVVFGGNSQSPDGSGKRFYGDLWILDTARSRWKMVHGPERGPGPRYGFGWTVAGARAWLCGGYDGERDRGDLWTLDLESLGWTLLAGEGAFTPRYCPALGMAGGALVLFGGRSKVRPRENHADTWLFRDGGWRSLGADASGPGYHAKAAYASDGRCLWVFGGEGPRGHVSDLWRFDGSRWECLHGARYDDPILW